MPIFGVIDGEKLKNVEKIGRMDLEVACEDFSNIIGSYQDTIVYKGTRKDGPEIAVVSLCIAEGNWTRYLEFLFQNKVKLISSMNFTIFNCSSYMEIHFSLSCDVHSGS